MIDAQSSDFGSGSARVPPATFGVSPKAAFPSLNPQLAQLSTICPLQIGKVMQGHASVLTPSPPAPPRLAPFTLCGSASLWQNPVFKIKRPPKNTGKTLKVNKGQLRLFD